MACWVVRMEDLGTPIAAAQQAAKDLGLKFKRRDQDVLSSTLCGLRAQANDAAQGQPGREGRR